MRVLVINPIMYTSETRSIHRVESIKDTMCYDLCLAFYNMGHNITLIGGEPYKPITNEKYPFKVIWMHFSRLKIFMPHCFPYMTELNRFLKRSLYKACRTPYLQSKLNDIPWCRGECKDLGNKTW